MMQKNLIKKANQLVEEIQKSSHKSISTNHARSFCGESDFVEIIKHLKYEELIENNNSGYQLTSKGYKYHPTKSKLKNLWKYVVGFSIFIAALIAFLNNGVSLFDGSQKLTEKPISVNIKDNSQPTSVETNSNLLNVESIYFDLNKDEIIDTIMLFQYANKDYLKSEFQSIKIIKSGEGYFYANLIEPYDFINPIINSKYNLIKSERLIITEVDSFYYVIISSKSSNEQLGNVSIFGMQNNMNPVFESRFTIDSISASTNKYYKYCLYGLIADSTTNKQVAYGISHPKYDEPFHRIE